MAHNRAATTQAQGHYCPQNDNKLVYKTQKTSGVSVHGPKKRCY